MWPGFNSPSILQIEDYSMFTFTYFHFVVVLSRLSHALWRLPYCRGRAGLHDMSRTLTGRRHMAVLKGVFNMRNVLR